MNKVFSLKFVKCEKCGSEMLLRKNKSTNTEFLGCSSFPKCRNTISFEEDSYYEGDSREDLYDLIDEQF